MKKAQKIQPGTDVNILYFGTENAKLHKLHTATFSIPAGHTCPGAKDCLAYFDRNQRKIVDGKHQQYRCFAASLEATYPSVRDSVDRNHKLLLAAKTTEKMADIIDMSLPAKRYHRIRVHVDGDFFSAAYFMAWMETARRNPDRLFYAYTKSIHLWVKYASLVPENFVLTASRGSKFDHLIDKHNLRHAVVVMHPDEAEALGLEIDHDDSHARDPGVHSFALLIHGTQPAGSAASAAIKRLKQEGVAFSYSRTKSKTSVTGHTANQR